MLGAIIGDLAGSIYEFDQVKKHKNIKIKNIIEDNSFYSDDTILTIAIAYAIINQKDYGETLKKYVIKYGNKLPKGIEYLKQCFRQDLWLGRRKMNKVLVLATGQ